MNKKVDECGTDHRDQNEDISHEIRPCRYRLFLTCHAAAAGGKHNTQQPSKTSKSTAENDDFSMIVQLSCNQEVNRCLVYLSATPHATLYEHLMISVHPFRSDRMLLTFKREMRLATSSHMSGVVGKRKREANRGECQVQYRTACMQQRHVTTKKKLSRVDHDSSIGSDWKLFTHVCRVCRTDDDDCSILPDESSHAHALDRIRSVFRNVSNPGIGCCCCAR